MFIKYSPKEPHVKTIPVVVKSSGGEGVPLANDSVILRPGTNELSESQWAAIQPHVQDEIKHKIIVPFTVPVKKSGEVTKARTLKDVPVAVARKIIESCQNVADLKKWVRQELPDEIMLLVLKRLRKFKIDPDEFGDDLTGEDDTLDADITPEGGADTDAEPTTPEGGADTDAEPTTPRRSRKKHGSGNGGGGNTEAAGNTKTPEDEPEDDEDEIPDFDGSGKE
jgi:hypothetical protein